MIQVRTVGVGISKGGKLQVFVSPSQVTFSAVSNMIVTYHYVLVTLFRKLHTADLLQVFPIVP